MKRLMILGLVVICSGCSGLEFGAKAGLYRVDEKQESQRTYRQSIPLKCYFISCGDDSQVEGS